MRIIMRSVLFWAHLSAGVVAGLVVMMMSVTGVILTYERQILDAADASHPVSCESDCSRLAVDALIEAAGPSAETERAGLLLFSDPTRAAKVSFGRERSLLVDPYNGEVLRNGESGLDGFFTTITRLHRWFALEGDARATGRAITGYSNLLFLFLLLSGIYLWLPPVWNRVALRTRILFNPKARTGKARDFNWHHVFSFWASIPLLVIICTATVFYFSWSNDLVYAAFGETPPERSRPAPAEPLPVGDYPAREALLLAAIDAVEEAGVTDWRQVSMQYAMTPGSDASFRFDRSIGGQPSRVVNLTLNGTSAEVASWQWFADRTPGQQARFIIRFLHTGEVLGFVGQTLAGLASLAACFLVWTGLALAWRRLIRPLFSRPAVVDPAGVKQT